VLYGAANTAYRRRALLAAIDLRTGTVVAKGDPVVTAVVGITSEP